VIYSGCNLFIQGKPGLSKSTSVNALIDARGSSLCSTTTYLKRLPKIVTYRSGSNDMQDEDSCRSYYEQAEAVTRDNLKLLNEPESDNI
jgi:hypothetical protein